VKAESENKL